MNLPAHHPDRFPRFDALVNHPAWGSLWLDNVRLRDGLVVGTAHFPHPASSFHDDPWTMNFPIRCIRKIDRRRMLENR